MATAFKAETPVTPLVTSADQLPDLYAMVGKGRCMEPEVMDGTCLAFDKHEEPVSGDTVILWFRPEFAKEDGTQCMYKRLVALPPVSLPFKLAPTSNCVPVVTVEMLNPPRRFNFPVTELLAVHKCIGPAEPKGNGVAALRRKKEVLA